MKPPPRPKEEDELKADYVVKSWELAVRLQGGGGNGISAVKILQEEILQDIVDTKLKGQ